MAFAATMVEEKERGQLFFGWFGTIETMVLLTIFYVTWLIPAVREWWVAPLAGGWPAYWILIGSGVIGCVATAVDCLRRVGRVPLQLAVFVGLNLALALALGKSSAPFGCLVAVMFLHGGDYVGRVIGTHLLRRPHAWPDFVGPLLAGALVWGAPSWLMTVMIGWLAVRTAWGIWSVLYPLRGDWRWKNPPPAPLTFVIEAHNGLSAKIATEAGFPA
eukprot:gene61062-83527_t